MLNRIVIVGRLARDPEMRYTPNGKAVATFTLAFDSGFNAAQGERETSFVRVVTWEKLADRCANYLTKGRMVAIDGKLRIRSYDNQEGQRVNVTEVVAQDVRFLDKGKESGGSSYGEQGPKTDSFEEMGGFDDIPF